MVCAALQTSFALGELYFTRVPEGDIRWSFCSSFSMDSRHLVIDSRVLGVFPEGASSAPTLGLGAGGANEPTFRGLGLAERFIFVGDDPSFSGIFPLRSPLERFTLRLVGAIIAGGDFVLPMGLVCFLSLTQLCKPLTISTSAMVRTKGIHTREEGFMVESLSNERVQVSQGSVVCSFPSSRGTTGFGFG